MTQTPTKRLAPDLTVEDGTAISLQVTKRDGRVVEFEPARIQRAIEAAFAAEYADKTNTPLSDEQRRHVENITAMVITACSEQDETGSVLEVEGVQDVVEEKLMRSGEFSVARRYIVYRQERNRARMLRMESSTQASDIQVTNRQGETQPLNTHLVKRRIYEACHGLPQCKPNELLQELYANLYNGITTTELEKAMVMIARQHIEKEPAYNTVATRLVLNIVYRQALGEVPAKQDF
ncbi:MAG: ATP cone domain-containing protein, partial [Planctomycetota bacterium]